MYRQQHRWLFFSLWREEFKQILALPQEHGHWLGYIYSLLRLVALGGCSFPRTTTTGYSCDPCVYKPMWNMSLCKIDFWVHSVSILLFYKIGEYNDKLCTSTYGSNIE
jgi:hypothetical protein